MPTMSTSAGPVLRVDADPVEMGMDPARLERLDRHFRRYLDDGRLPGWLIAVVRHGRVVHLGTAGRRDIEADLPVEPDTLWRIYSMTKPITSVAAMMLWEEGAFELKDPVARFIPSFADTRVWNGGNALKPVTVPQIEPMRIWHLLTHTAGLTYGFHHAHSVDRLYREAGFEWGSPPGLDLEGVCDAWAAMPLLFQPGSEWNYSVATDVLGRVVEVASGQSLDAFLAEHVLGPLGMTDTAFAVAADEMDRLAALYLATPGGGLQRSAALGDAITRPAVFLSGGGGLVSTAADYHRFTQLLLRGGELDGVRLLSPRTIAYMTRNHLPGHVDLEMFGRPVFAESTVRGVGFGLGVSVVIDPSAVRGLTSAGEYAWGGLASTAFYVDPLEEITASFFTQLVPSSTYPIRSQLRTLVMQALVDSWPS
jgi:CubicO group peptidase (beta-lactamase class C family)